MTAAPPAVDIAIYRDEHFAAVSALWQVVFPGDPPWNRAEIAIPEKLRLQPDLFFVALSQSRVVGTAMAGYDGHRGWLYAIAVDPAHRRTGVGSALLAMAETRLAHMGCSKINLQIRAGNEAVAGFYRAHGYAVEERVSMGKRLAG